MKTENEAGKAKTCREETEHYSKYRSRLIDLVNRIVDGCDDTRCYSHIDYEQLPSRSAVIEMIHKFREILFPGYFNRARLDPANLSYHIGQTVAELFDMLAEQISRSIRHECFKYDLDCTDCRERGYRHALSLLESVPEMQSTLAPSDIQIRTHDTSKSSARFLSTT